jgi:hypothetical protein
MKLGALFSELITNGVLTFTTNARESKIFNMVGNGIEA